MVSKFSAELSDAVIGFDINQGMLHLFPLENANGVAEMVITASNPVRASVSDTVLVTVFAMATILQWLVPLRRFMLQRTYH